MALLGRIMFIAGFLGLSFQIAESWLGMTGLPITRDHMFNAMLWWTGFGVVAALGVVINRKFGSDDSL